MIMMFEKKDDARGLGGGFTYEINGYRIPRGFTTETGRLSAERFKALLERNEPEVLALVKEYHERLEFNTRRVNEGGAGQFWPIFNRIEKFLGNLQKQAGIKDT